MIDRKWVAADTQCPPRSEANNWRDILPEQQRAGCTQKSVSDRRHGRWGHLLEGDCGRVQWKTQKERRTHKVERHSQKVLDPKIGTGLCLAVSPRLAVALGLLGMAKEEFWWILWAGETANQVGQETLCSQQEAEAMQGWLTGKWWGVWIRSLRKVQQHLMKSGDKCGCWSVRETSERGYSKEE